MPYASSQLEKAKRINVIWDVYMPDSLKSSTQEKRGKGTRRRVTALTAIPRNWKDFLRVDGNKKELFSFLSQQITSAPTAVGKKLYAIDGEKVL